MSGRIIQTAYSGCRFRSRLEARWAVFYDALGVAWEYEREAYALGPIGTTVEPDGTHTSWTGDEDYGELAYLPDFWLPTLNCWVEIKGARPTDLECLKAARLSHVTNKDMYIFFGDIPTAWDTENLVHETASAYKIFVDAWGMDEYYAWCECSACGAVGIEYSGYADRLRCGCESRKHSTVGAPRIASAYNKARGYRFEPKRHASQIKRGDA